VYALCDGVFTLGAAIFAKGGDMAPRWWLALAGLISILAGLVTFIYPFSAAAQLTLRPAIEKPDEPGSGHAHPSAYA